jgi:MFS family permease
VPDLTRVVRRNTFLLAATLAVNSAVVQLVAAVSSLTFVHVTGVRGLLGLGPAIFLVSSGALGAVGGRAMDSLGRRPVLVAGFLAGAVGCAVTALATSTRSTPLVVLGFVLVGAASASSLLVRAAAGDMYMPERRARGIAYVLFGSVFGAILGPTVFSPLFSGEREGHVLAIAWVAAAGLGALSAVVASLVRPDTKRIAEALGTHADEPAPGEPAAPLAEIIRRPGMIPAMLAAFASFGVMVSVMNLAGYVVVEIHEHARHDVFPIIGAHVLGMFALVLVIGTLIDRIGRTPALAGGLFVMGLSTIALAWLTSVPQTALLLFGLGIGWNISYVAASATLADLTLPSERGRLFGFNDMLASLFAATLALVGGLTLEAFGVLTLALGATILVTAPAPWILRRSAFGYNPPPAGGESAVSST